MSIREVQLRLRQLGFDPGPVDGVAGPRTNAAVVAFQQSAGLVPDGVVGPLTRRALFPTLVADRTARPASTLPPWLANAVAEIGVKEVAGRDSNKRIIAYRILGKTTDDTETEDGSRPWCGDFVCAMLETAGVRSARSGMARAVERSPHFIRLEGPALGAIVTQWRKSRTSGFGHTYFYGGQFRDKTIAAIGGNQNDAVTNAPYGTSRIVGYFWPAGVPLPVIGHVPAIMPATGKAGRET